MRYTNNHNLPAPLYAALTNSAYKKVGDISVTGLISSPRQRILMKRHHEKIVVDASENVFSLIGQMGHAVLERAATKNEVSEMRMKADVNGWVVSGQPDLYESLHVSGGMLSDYKVTSVFSFLLGDKPEWECQLNSYAWLCSLNGIEVKSLQIVAILRDWQRRTAQRDSKYPQVGVHLINVPLWPLAKTEAWVYERVKIHQDAEKMADNSLPECSDIERWQREGQWAVMKDGGKRAVRVLETEEAANAVKDAKGAGHSVVYRPGEAIKCDSFCHAKPFCSQFKATVPEGVDFSMTF